MSGTFPSVRIEGGLLGPDILDQLAAGELPGQRAADFGLDGKRNLTDEIAAAFADARALWQVFQHRLERVPQDDLATSVTRDAWVIPFLGLLGYELRYNQKAYEVDNLTFAISHRAGEPADAPPVHVVGIRQELGRVPPSGRPRLAPHSLLQEYLNRTENLWGVVTNGKTLRLLRDCTFVRRQAYVEFDLPEILDEQRFQDFAALYRLVHRTRFPRTAQDADHCLLEQYYQHSIEQGGRVRDRLRDGVEECLVRLANGFLRHTDNDDLRRRVAGTGNDPITPEELYRQLLILVYRFLFLLVSEDRGLLSADPLYREHYSIGRLRRLLNKRAAFTGHDDLWQSLRVLWLVLIKDQPQPALGNQPMAAALGLPVLNGDLFEPLALDNCTITNADLLDALWYLVFYEQDRGIHRAVNYAALDVEELGSVYESLLEFEPSIDTTAHPAPRFDLVPVGGERRSTGSHYTPPELVAPLVEHALKPVLQERLAAVSPTSTGEGRRERGDGRTERGRTRRSPLPSSLSSLQEQAILSIRICDPACGSGHFLLAAARFLGKELARIRTGEDEPAPERVREATRDVISHCIYGVDKNPLAVELCRVALWLEAHTAGHPLTFLKHRIRCGDSLVGLRDLDVLAEGIPDAAFKPVHGDNRAMAREAKRANASQRSGPLFQKRFQESLQRFADPIRRLDEIPEDTPEQIRHKRQVCEQVENTPEFRSLRLACDVWTAAFFQEYAKSAPQPITTQTLRDAVADGDVPDPRQRVLVFQLRGRHRFFHWPLAFPEVFADGGFDVILGNPPFLGGLRISGTFGDRYRKWLEEAVRPFAGRTDLCAAFFRRAYGGMKIGGRLGMIATNTIGQGYTRESGLRVIVDDGGSIVFAKRFVKWPGQANVEVNLVAVHRGPLPPGSTIELDGQAVEFISSRLDAEPEAEPRPLPQNVGRSFMGDNLHGIGFVIEREEAQALLEADSRNRDCLFPYLNGEDVNTHPQQEPSRWVICFHDWDLEEAKRYPELLRIVEERVKPGRDKLTHSRYKRIRDHWWHFVAYGKGLRRAIAPLRRVLVRAQVSEMHQMVFVPKGWVYSMMVIVFAFDDDYHFALLQSNVHEAWLRRQASSLRTDVRYTPTDCFATFPFPPEEYRRMANGEWRMGEMPEPFHEAARVGAEYHEHRRRIMLARNQGLTATYNLFHNPDCTDADIRRLRELHAEMDRAVLACYGWQDFECAHGFHQNERGQTRFTISPEARRDLLHRLLELNLELSR